MLITIGKHNFVLFTGVTCRNDDVTSPLLSRLLERNGSAMIEHLSVGSLFASPPKLNLYSECIMTKSMLYVLCQT